MDCEYQSLRRELVEETEARVNAEVAAARDVRIVQIVGLNLQAGGGTHATNSREVGQVHVAGYESKGRIDKRIRIELAP